MTWKLFINSVDQKMSSFIPLFALSSILALSLHAKSEHLWKGTFDGWSVGFKSEPRERDHYWEIAPNGELHVLGDGSYQTQSGLRTNQKFGNYVLTLEYKWMTPGEGPKFGNSGIWIHGQEGWDRAGGAFPKSIEVQLKKKAAGDLLRKGLEIDEEPGQRSEGEAVFRRGDESVIEYFYDRWNKVKIVCHEDTISVWLNDVFINKAIHCRTRDGEPVTSGYITLQSEIQNLAFRNIVIEPIKR